MRRHLNRRGQTVVFLLMALTVLAFVFLWNVDLHRIVSAKNLSQNAGDSAALAAARWQGTALNLMGELNLMHALALSAQDETAVDAITNIQARLCFTGPLVGLVAAQVAAKNNRIYAYDDFTLLLREHADQAEQYGTPVAGGLYYPEPYPGAWDEYAAMLRAIAADGVAAAPDNTRLYSDSSDGHILRERAFYEAVDGRNWCWFFLNHRTGDTPVRTILDDYTDHTWWPPLPDPNPPNFNNCEIFGLGVVPRTTALRGWVSEEDLRLGAAQQEIDFSGFIPSNVMTRVETWYAYSRSSWKGWSILDPDGPDGFPVVGPPRPEYDYTGADAVTRVYATAQRLTPAAGGAGVRDEVVWTAAAKPFGYLESEAPGESRVRPDACGLVLPAFRDVRLIPIDASSGSGGGAFDLAWRRHIDEHLPLYVSTGRTQAGCAYCNSLNTWEVPGFRRTGSAWLARYNYLCTLPSGGGGGGGHSRGGGTRRGH